MADTSQSLDRLSDQLSTQPKQRGLPPVEKWNPPLSGDIDICIKRDGTWLHEGTPILRKELVSLFSTILKREGDEYFLVTPVEKWRIQVEDAPLHAVAMSEVRVDQQPALQFETMTGDLVVADAQHPIRVTHDSQSGEPSPYILVRRNLEALINRNVFYQLVDLAQEVEEDGSKKLYVSSAGERFLLGNY